MADEQRLTGLEICAGAGGQFIGLEQAGFDHTIAVEIEPEACETLRINRPNQNVHQGDVRDVNGKDYKGIDLLSGGVPCPPFSIAGKQLGADDERDLFPEALRLVREAQPGAVMLENVKGLAGAKFAPYRDSILAALDAMGYDAYWHLLFANDFGVPQLRPRFVLAAIKRKYLRKQRFEWHAIGATAATVGETLYPMMSANGWLGAEAWRDRANGIAPTVVGGSRKHGGPDLGPTRARAAWLELGVDGRSIADAAPDYDTPADHTPRLTLPMVAAIQGFPGDWKFSGRKTAAYRQVGNAFPPPVAKAVGLSIRAVLTGTPLHRLVEDEGDGLTYSESVSRASFHQSALRLLKAV
ncbi:DNA cytosine methyltransferase [Cellulomonas sp. NPDC089187]|uniref:DNA cytosine methyltransferase n=1 Tax=Cellulomonas sp. NPDC089187 TaxID=3154970 RepID=UPI003428B30E